MIGLDHCAYTLKWDGRSSEAYRMEKVFCIEKEFANHGLGISKCDPTGRLYTGTYNTRFCDPEQPFDCALYSYDTHQGVQKRVSGLKVSNGMAWPNKGNYFYHIDSCFMSIREFRWDRRTGELCKYPNMMNVEVKAKSIF